jgi:mannose-P-dolichol utilization defect 1
MSGSWSFATLVGYLLTCAACAYKLPLIRNILKARSTVGLSVVGMYLEISGHIASVAYNYSRGNPFSSYGDTFVTTLQEVVIILCMLWFGSGTTPPASVESATTKEPEKASTVSTSIKLLSGLLVFVTALAWSMRSPSTQSYAIGYSIAMAACSKLPQIYKNFIDQRQGVQSLYTATSAFLGPVVKCYIVIVQVKDPLLIGGALLTLILSGILFAQLVSFRWYAEQHKQKVT